MSTITNAGTIYGEISGTDGLPVSADTRFTIENNGKIFNKITLGKLDDVYHGELGTISGVVKLGDGADKAYGGEGAETFEGEGGDDTLSGGGGADKLLGGAGSNLIDGGAGNDTITKSVVGVSDTISGGADIDTLIYSGTVGVTLNLSVATAPEYRLRQRHRHGYRERHRHRLRRCADRQFGGQFAHRKRRR